MATLIQSHAVRKKYLARVRGSFPTDAKSAESIASVIARHPGCDIQWKDDAVTVSSGIRCVNPRIGVYECHPDGKRSTSVFRLRRQPQHDVAKSTDDAVRKATSVVECEPVTGRTHQLRLHLQLLGYPIANDAQYGGDRTLPYHLDGSSGKCIKANASDALRSTDAAAEKTSGADEDLEVRARALCRYCKDPELSPLRLLSDGIWLHASEFRTEDKTFAYESTDTLFAVVSDIVTIAEPDAVVSFDIVGVRSISLNHDIVGCLRPLAHLEHLKLMGNPCTLSPSYKSFVASELSSLIELDGIPCDELRKVKSTGTTIENASNMKENIVQFHVRVDRVQQTRVADHLSDAIGAFEANRKTLAAKREDGRAMTKIDVRQIIRESKESVACAFELEFSFARAAWTSGEIGTETDPKKNVVHSKSIERVTPTVDVRDSIVAPGLVCTLYEIASMTASTPILETTCDVDHDKEKKEEEEKDLETTTDVATGNTNDAKEDTVVESTDAKEEEPRRVRRRLATGSVDTSKFIDGDCTKISDTLSFRTDDVDWVAWIASEKFARLPEDEIASDIRDACACASYSCEVTIEISYG
eukprot:g3587.t1